MEITERNVQEIGKSCLISLPKGWTRARNIKKGSKVKIMTSENGNLIIAPEFTGKDQKKTAMIKYDSHFNRRFFQEYFKGNETITITFDSITEKERKMVYLFLKRFMSCQIIEESKKDIIVKSFKIEELSIEECLKRMHFLSLSLFEEIYSTRQKLKLDEIRENMSRFYYLLVMQIRRFLSEGKYADFNQISLIRAMDIRMVAEKIQRIGELIVDSEFSPAEMKFITEIDRFYSNAFNYFLKEDFEKALPLWSESKSLLKKTSSQSLIQIIKLSKEISMLVR